MHSRHALPPPVEYNPLAQLVQPPLLFWALNFPGWQAVHSGSSGNEKKPSGHTPQIVAPAAENSPAEHTLQLRAEVPATTTEKVPGLHFVQFPAVMNPEPVPYVPAVQEVQVPLVLAPDDVENVPDSQKRHACDSCMPVPVWKVPG